MKHTNFFHGWEYFRNVNKSQETSTSPFNKGGEVITCRQQELHDEEQLPDRLENPCEYQQLSQNRNNNKDGSETDNLPVSIEAYTNDYGSTQ